MQAPTIHGLDVSQHQPTSRLSWKKLHTDHDIQFAIARAGFGIGPDPSCATHLRQAREGGVPILGAYHVLRTQRNVRAQADLLIRALEPWGSDTLAILDFEIMGGSTPQEVGDAGLNFLETFEAITSRVCWLYTYPSFAAPLKLDARYANHPLHIAHYPAKGKTLANPTVPQPWKDWSIWQCSGDGGFSTDGMFVDLNVFRGSVDDLRSCIRRSPLA